MWENVYLVIVSALCMAWFALVGYERLLVELLCGFVKRNAFQVDSFKALRSSLTHWELIWVNFIENVKNRIHSWIQPGLL